MKIQYSNDLDVLWIAVFMHLSSFGLISLDGSVTKLEPGLDFASYQTAMANYTATIALKSKVLPGDKGTADSTPEPTTAPSTDAPASIVPRPLQPATPLARKKPSLQSAADLVKLFRR